jgi:hypothetical protein
MRCPLERAMLSDFPCRDNVFLAMFISSSNFFIASSPNRNGTSGRTIAASTTKEESQKGMRIAIEPSESTVVSPNLNRDFDDLTRSFRPMERMYACACRRPMTVLEAPVSGTAPSKRRLLSVKWSGGLELATNIGDATAERLAGRFRCSRCLTPNFSEGWPRKICLQ